MHVSIPANSSIGNIRSDLFGSGDDLTDAKSMVDKFAPSSSEVHAKPRSRRSKQEEDLASALERIISTGEASMGVENADIHVDSPLFLENAKVVRSLARLALLPPEKLSTEAQERLKRVVNKLDGIDLPS